MNREEILNTELTPGQVLLTYLGQVGFLIRYGGKTMLIDPYLTDYVDRKCSNERVTWIRNYPAPIAPEALDFVDYVFCTHAHSDHADPETLSVLTRINPQAKFIVSRAIVDAMVGKGVSREAVIGIACDEVLELDENITVTAIPSAHEELHPTGEKNVYAEVGFLLSLGKTKIYHAGDGCPYDGLAERLTGCDIAMLPINGRDYYRTQLCNIIGCFDSREAILLSREIGVKLLIPTHFDLYSVNGVNPAHFVDLLHTLNPTQAFHIFAPGERYIWSR